MLKIWFLGPRYPGVAWGTRKRYKKCKFSEHADSGFFFFLKPSRIRLSINLRAVAKADSRSLPPVAPRLNLAVYNPLATLLNRRRPSHLRKADQAQLAGPACPHGSTLGEDGELGMVIELS